MTMSFNLDVVDSSWRPHVKKGLSQIDCHYLEKLQQSSSWLPGSDKIFNAFSIPLNQVNYVLFGESPYPRAQSANGYAFWDNAVETLWIPTGMSKQVNRATSLRNMIKMFLVAEGLLEIKDTSQEAIARIDKTPLVKTNKEFFQNFMGQGFLLLNATPVLQPHSPQIDARQWQPFVAQILNQLLQQRPGVKLILFGRIANQLKKILIDYSNIDKLCVEHPYNHSFISNTLALEFFKPLNLLIKRRNNKIDKIQ